MEVTLSVIIAAQFDSSSEVPQPIESEARGCIELVFHIGYVFHGVIFFDAQHLFLVQKEVGEEFFFHLGPFHPLEGGNIMFIINLEGMLKVLPPPSTPIFGSPLLRVTR